MKVTHGKVTVTIKRLSPGNYVFTRESDSKEWDVYQLREGDFKGYWMVTTGFGHDYNDPLPSYAEARSCALDWANDWDIV